MDVLGDGLERRAVAGIENGRNHDTGVGGRNADDGRLYSPTRESVDIQVNRRSIVGDGDYVQYRRAVVVDLRNLDRFAACDSSQRSDPSFSDRHHLTENQIRIVQKSLKDDNQSSCKMMGVLGGIQTAYVVESRVELK